MVLSINCLPEPPDNKCEVFLLKCTWLAVEVQWIIDEIIGDVVWWCCQNESHKESLERQICQMTSFIKLNRDMCE